MNEVHLRITDPTVAAIVKAGAPGYNGKRVHAVVTDRVSFTGTNWDEGNKNDYKVVRLADMTAVSIPTAPWMQRSDLHDGEHGLPPGFVVVRNHIGRYDHVTIYTHADNITPLLPPPSDLTEDERTVLAATAGLKSSYGGISNYRFREANRHRGITLDRWNAAKETLIGKKLLNKSGAITPEGRNAIGRERL